MASETAGLCPCHPATLPCFLPASRALQRPPPPPPPPAAHPACRPPTCRLSSPASHTGGGNGAGGSDLSTTQRDYRRYQSPNGLVVLVGRNSRQNDELTMKVAQPGDVWMHAR